MLLIKNGRIIDPKTQQDFIGHVLIDDKKIVQITREIPENLLDNVQIIDATGKIVAPGLIDVHVHFREPGQTQKETIHTGAQAAAAGGFTTVVMMANTNPVISTPELVTENLQIASQEPIHIKTVASVTANFDGQTVTDFAALKNAGAVGFSDDGIPLRSSAVVRQAFEKAVQNQALISLHEEDPELIGSLGVNATDQIKHQCGLDGAPTVSEYSMVARDVMIAYATKARFHVQHLSAGESVAVVRFAKALGANVTAEVTPQHFSLTDQAVLEVGPNAKVNPPLRDGKDVAQVIEGLKDGTIDVIATDHAPHTLEEKNHPLGQTPSGMIGLETSLQLGLTHLVAPGHLSLIELLQKMTLNPAQLYGFEAGYLAENGPADIVIFDADKVNQVPETFHSKGSNSPFIHQEVLGEICYTICDGEIVFAGK